MSTGKKINVVRLDGYSFEINGHWDIDAMKDSICCHMDKKLMNEYLNKYGTYKGWCQSEEYKEAQKYCPRFIILICNNEPLEQYHIECDLVDLREVKTLTFVIDVQMFDYDVENDNYFDDDNTYPSEDESYAHDNYPHIIIPNSE